MLNKKNSLFLFLFLSFFQKGFAHKSELASESSWYLYKISKYNLFGESDPIAVDRISQLYGDVEFNISDNRLTVKNNLLESPVVCNINYVKAKETTLSYFFSQKTVDLYDKLMAREGIDLSKNIYIYYPLKPSETCPPTYNEPIEYSGFLFLNIDNYIVFFSKNEKKKKEKKEDFSYFCQNKKIGSIYDGESQYVCSFNGYDIFESYIKLIDVSGLGVYLKKKIPMDNVKYIIDNASVTYNWINKNKLKIDIISDEKIEIYLIENTQGIKNNTEVSFSVITGY
ncbi:TPA: hypothetical protein U2M22_001518 [Providencia stuartii]|uniref:hypothetical protein n=1 Tax=Providencia stuartii TaxID=588 RepID=UPI000C9CF1DF|nr:Uncharacterised protein [Providencia stuartii]HEM8214744.1 hypothetical protein [Providencia stuartii]